MGTKKIDETWVKLFEKYDILEEINSTGYYIISANQIKTVYEPRLVTKFDHSINLPQIFKQNAISILPISRGKYILSKHSMFFQFEDTIKEVNKIQFPGNIESIDIDNITSEAIALNSSFLSGMLEDFVQDSNLVPTVTGRMSSGKFSFEILNTETKTYENVDIENSQIEIDGAYEGEQYLSLIEAKQNISSDFLIRQIYYPYRVWKDKVSKEVKLIYFIYSNGVFTLYEYKFKDPNKYNSLKLVKQKKYTFDDLIINLETIKEIIDNTDIVAEPKIPFPQADDFNKVINLCELARNQELNKELIASEYEFNIRQSDYYTNACRYLGLMDKKRNKEGVFYLLSEDGQSMLNMNYINRQLFLVKRIVEHEIFKDMLNYAFHNGKSPSTKEIKTEMNKYDLYNVGKIKEDSSTFDRRASSIRGWIEWILSIIEE